MVSSQADMCNLLVQSRQYNGKGDKFGTTTDEAGGSVIELGTF